MKILHLVGDMRLPHDPDHESASGVITATLALAAAQKRRGHHVWVASIGQQAWRAEWRGVTLLQLRLIDALQLQIGKYQVDLRSHIPYLLLTLRQSFDVIHGAPYYYLRFLRAGMRVVYFHTDPLYQGSGEINTAFSPADFALISRTTDAQLAVSAFVARQLQTGLGSYLAHIHVLYNGVDTARFDRTRYAEARQRIRAAWGVTDQTTVFLFAGAIVPEKGVLPLAQAFAHVAQQRSDTFLSLAGGSALWLQNLSQSDPAAIYEQEVRQTLQPAVEGGQACFLGRVSAATMPEIYAAADLVVVPSIWNDPFPLVVLEALASGCPVVASAVGGLPESVDQSCGLLLPPGDQHALVASMLDLIDHPHRRQQLAQGALQRARRFNWDATADQLDTIYHQYAAQKGS